MGKKDKVVLAVVLIALCVVLLTHYILNRKSIKFDDYISGESNLLQDVDSEQEDIIEAVINNSREYLLEYGVKEEELYNYTVVVNYDNRTTLQYDCDGYVVYLYIDNQDGVYKFDVYSSLEAG